MSPTLSPGRRHSALFIAAMIALGCAAFTFFLSTPLLVPLMARQWGFTPSHIGFIVTADTAGNTLGALAVALGIRGWPVRRLMGLGMLAMMGGNGLIAGGLGLPASMLGGLIAGVGNGVVSGTAMGFLAYSDKPQRNIGLMVVCQNLYAMLLMGGIIPGISNHWQASGTFVFVAAVSIVCVPAALLFARGETIPAAFRQGEVHKLGVYLTLLCLYTCYAGVGVIWTFLGTLAESAGLSKPFIAQVLAVGNFSSLGACFLVQAMARHNLYGWSLGVVSASAAAAVVLALPLTPTSFITATIVFVGCWTLTGILVPTLLPVYDPVGRHAALTPAVLGLGYSTGSMLGGLIGEAASPRSAFGFAAACVVLSVLALVSQRLFAGKGKPPLPGLRPA